MDYKKRAEEILKNRQKIKDTQTTQPARPSTVPQTEADDWNTRSLMGTIARINEWNPNMAQKLMGMFREREGDTASKYYNPYSRASNRAVDRLTGYGIDTSEINDEWYKNNAWLRDHYKFSTYTNNPVSPGKRASDEQKAAYEYYQMLLAEDQTKQAEKEQEELRKYLIEQAKSTSRTLSDAEIVAGIDWSKYPTLEKMRTGASRGTPLELNRAVYGSSDDWAYATLWEAMNEGKGGDYYSSLANSYLGRGRTFEKDLKARENTDKWQQITRDAAYGFDGVDGSYLAYMAKQSGMTPEQAAETIGKIRNNYRSAVNAASRGQESVNGVLAPGQQTQPEEPEEQLPSFTWEDYRKWKEKNILTPQEEQNAEETEAQKFGKVTELTGRGQKQTQNENTNEPVIAGPKVSELEAFRKWQEQQQKGKDTGRYDDGDDPRLMTDKGLQEYQIGLGQKIAEADEQIRDLKATEQERDEWYPDNAYTHFDYMYTALEDGKYSEGINLNDYLPGWTREQIQDRAQNYYYDRYTQTKWQDSDTARAIRREQMFDIVFGYGEGSGIYEAVTADMSVEDKANFDLHLDEIIEDMDNPLADENYDDDIQELEGQITDWKKQRDAATREAKTRARIKTLENNAPELDESKRPEKPQYTGSNPFQALVSEMSGPQGDETDRIYWNIKQQQNKWNNMSVAEQMEWANKIAGIDSTISEDLGMSLAESTKAYAQYYAFMTPEQVDTFDAYYLSGDKESAKAYMEALGPYLMTARQIYTEETARENAKGKYGSIYGLGTVIGAPMNGLMGLTGTVLAGLGDERAQQAGSEYYLGQNSANAIREERANTISGWAEKNIGEWTKEPAKFLTQVFYSMADNLMAMGVASGFGLAGDVSQPLVQLIMSSEAASSKMNELLKSGKDPDEAAIYSIGSGIIEAITEKYSLEALLKPDVKELLGNRKAITKFILKNFAAEGSEEGASDVLEMGLDWMLSMLNGHENELQAKKKALVKGGMKPKEADQKVFEDKLQEIGLDMLAGGVSGLFMSGGRVGINAVEESQMGRNITSEANTENGKSGAEQLVEAATKMKEGTESRKAAEKIKAGKKKASNYELGRLAQNIMMESSEQIGEAARGTVEREAREQLTGAGVDSTAAGELAPIIAKHVTDGESSLTAEEKSAIAGNEEAVKLLKSFYSDPTARMDLYMKQMADTADQRSIRQQVADLVSGEGTNRVSASSRSVAEAVQGANVASASEIRQATGRSTGAANEIIYNNQIGTISGIRNGEAQITVNGQQQSVALRDVKAINPTAAAVITFQQKNTGLMSEEYAGRVLQGIGQNSKTETAKYLDDAMKIRLAAMSLNAQPKTSLDSKTAADLYAAAKAEFDAAEQKRIAGAKPGAKPGQGSATLNGTEYGTAEFQEEIRKLGLSKQVRNQAGALSEISVRAGYRVNFINDTEHRDVYGWYDNGSGAITINLAGENEAGVSHHLLVTAGHEMTHWLEQNSKTGYAQLRQFVVDRMRARGENVEQRLVQTIDNFNAVMGEKSEGLDLNGAMAEVVANACDQVLGSQEVANELAKVNPSLYNKVKNFVKNFVARVRQAIGGMNQSLSKESGLLLKDVEQLAKIWLGAREEALGNTVSETELNQIIENAASNKQFSIKTLPNGKRYVELDIEQEQFKKLRPAQILKAAKGIIIKKFAQANRNRYLLPDKTGYVTVTGETANEYVFPAKREMTTVEKKVKGKASTELDNLIKTSWRVKPGDPLYPNPSDNHEPKNMKYYATLFRVNGDKFYTGILNVQIRKNSQHLIDITQIKEDTSLSGRNNVPPPATKAGTPASVGNNIPKVQRSVKQLSTRQKLDPEQDRLLDAYLAERENVEKLRERMRGLKPEMDAWVDTIMKAQGNGTLDDTLAEYKEWEKGYSKIQNDLSEAERRYKEANKAYDDYIEQRDVAEERKKIQESGMSEPEWRRKQAVKEFGYTTDFREAGYLLPNGKMLNFSGEKGRHYGSRGQDHRGISTVYASNEMQGGAAMIAFMRDGNIRVMAETPGVDIITSQEPTKEQYAAIQNMARRFADKEYFNVDFTDDKGFTVDSIEYDGRVNPERIANDIKRFFQTGQAPRQSIVSRFHYSVNQKALKADLEETNGPETAYGDHRKFSVRVKDPKELDFLNNQKTIKTYKSMQLIDGKLYPPMAAVVAGSMEDASELGQWEKATEHPELIKNGNKFTLNKGKGKGSLDAAYNPYMHSSNLMINDQFSGAYNRPNLVTVECEVPVSEETSGYHADFAKDSVGWHSWHTGPVAGQLRKASGTERQVFLSRWIKPVRIVSDSETAAHYAKLLKGTDIEVPDNVVTPSLLQELKKQGVKIKESGRVSSKQFSVQQKTAGNAQKNIEGVSDGSTVDDIDKVERVSGTPSTRTIIGDERDTVNKDKEYKEAVERGDLETATRLLMEKLENTEGITAFKAPNWDSGKSREIARLLKKGNTEAIAQAAVEMKQHVPENAVLIPMPGRSGVVADDSWTMKLANAISDLTGRPVIKALEGAEHESRQEAKARGELGASQAELGFRKVAEIPEGTMPIFIDNVVGKGITADAAREAMGGGITLAYTKTLRSPGIIGLKNAIVTYDKNKKLIPLSQRFDVSKRDVRYSVQQKAVQEAAERAFPNSKARTPDGKLMPVYHGTKADFNVFDTSVSGGVNGTQEGFGIYLTDNPEITKDYGNRRISAYVNMQRPAYGDRKTIKRAELAKVIKATVEKEAREFVEEGSYDNVQEAMADTWISNYVYTPEYPTINAAINAVADAILQQNDNDADIVGELIIGQGIRDYGRAMDFYHDILTPTIGIDGIWQKWNNHNTGETSNILLAFDSSQIKSNEDVTYDDQGNPIPLDQRFDTSKKDIRYSISEPNSRGTRELRNADGETMLEILPGGTLTASQYAIAQGDMNVNRWMLGLNPETLNTEQERNLLKQYKGLRMDLDIQLHAIDNYTKQLNSLEAKKNPSAYDREQMRKLRILIENREQRREKLQDEMIRVTSSEGYAGMMYRSQNLMNALVNNRTADDVRKTVDAISKEIERVTDEMAERGERLKELAETEGVAVARTYFANSGIKKAAAKLKSELNSKMANKEIESRMAMIALKMGKGENVVDDVADLAMLLTSRQKTDFDSYVLSELRGRTILISEAQMQEIKAQHRTLRDIQREIAGSGIRLKTGKGNTLDKNWDELCDRLPMLDRDINDLDMLDNLVSVVKSEMNLARESQFGSMEQVSGMVLEAVIDLVGKEEKVDSAVKEMISFIRSMAGEAKEAAQTIQDLRAAVDRLKLQTAQARGAVSVLDRDVGKALEYFNALTEQSEAAIWRSERAKLIAQMKDEKTEALLAEQDKWKKKIERDKQARQKMQDNLQLRKSITTNVTRVRKLLVNETDIKNIPEHMKSLARHMLQKIVENDLINRKITGIAKKDLLDTKRVLDIMQQQDGVFSIDDLKLISDEEAQSMVAEALADLEDGIGFYNARSGKDMMANLQAQFNSLDRIAEAVSTITSVINAERSISFMDRRVPVADAAADIRRDMGKSRFRGELAGRGSKAINTARSAVVYGNMTPVYFFKNLRNKGMMDQWNEMARGENRSGLEMQKAKSFIGDLAARTGYREWADQTHEVILGGRKTRLNIQNMMELYAIWKREHTLNPEMSEHLTKGGIYIDDGSMDDREGKLRHERKQQRAVRVTDDEVQAILSKMTPQQVEYMEGMVSYLSNDMSELGNEASMRMYGIKKYKESYYFPMKVWDGVKSARSDKGISGMDENRAAHKSWSKRRQHMARNALVIGNFTDDAVKHIVEMINYNTMAPAIENINKVLNYQFTEGMDEDTMTKRNLRIMFQEAYGQEALKYLETFMRDLNGGTVQDQRKTLRDRALSIFKKNAVAGSASVALQQPLSYIRAAMMINPKYLAGALSPQYWKGSYEEMMKHSGVAVIKDMGRFDMNFGQSAKDFITPEGGKPNVYEKVSDILTKAPELMDRMTWTRMWSAVKMEQHAQHPEMDVTSDKFLNMVGERFNELMRRTQVYDSVLVKSSNMRSQNLGMKVLTSFMAEPTLSLNVLADAVRGAIAKDEGAKGILARAGATFILSAICQAVVKGLMGSGRTPDDKKTWLENFMNKTQYALMNEANPLSLVPGYSDLIEVLKTGELKDDAMGVLGKLTSIVTTAQKALQGKGSGVWRDLEDTVGQFAQLFTNIPAKNLSRDVRAMRNWIVGDKYANRATSGVVLKYQRQANWFSGDNLIGTINTWLGDAGFKASNAAYYQQIYEARKAGNDRTAEEIEEFLTKARGVKPETITSKVNSLTKGDSSLTEAQRAEALIGNGSEGADEYIIKQLKEGKIGREEAIKLLKQQDPKKDANDIWWKVDRAIYQRESGEEKVSGCYYRLEEAMKNNKATEISGAVKELLNHGVEKKNIKNQISRMYKQEYLTAGSTEKIRIRDAIEKAYKALGLTVQDADKVINGWKPAKGNQ